MAALLSTSPLTTSLNHSLESSSLVTMALVDLPDEILLHIFSHHDILERGDLCHLTLICWRINHPAVVSLYTSLKLHCLDREDNTGIQRLNRLNSTLDSHQARALWTRSADLAWCANASEPTIRRFGLLARFPAIVTLKLRAWTWELPFLNSPNWTNRPRAASVTNPSELLHQSLFAPCLRNLTIDDAYLSIADIAKIFTLPKLNYLNIVRFDEMKSKGIEVRDLDSARLCNLKEFRLVITSPPTEAFTSFILHKHPHLQRLTWEFDGREDLHRPHRQILADSVVHLLQPLSAALLELRLSMNWWVGIQQSHPLDLSHLQVLKVLDVSGEIILPLLKPGDPVPPPLHERLPTSLQILIVSSPK